MCYVDEHYNRKLYLVILRMNDLALYNIYINELIINIKRPHK